MIVKHRDDCINDTHVGTATSLRLPNLLWVSAALGNEVYNVKHNGLRFALAELFQARAFKLIACRIVADTGFVVFDALPMSPISEASRALTHNGRVGRKWATFFALANSERGKEGQLVRLSWRGGSAPESGTLWVTRRALRVYLCEAGYGKQHSRIGSISNTDRTEKGHMQKSALQTTVILLGFLSLEFLFKLLSRAEGF